MRIAQKRGGKTKNSIGGGYEAREPRPYLDPRTNVIDRNKKKNGGEEREMLFTVQKKTLLERLGS